MEEGDGLERIRQSFDELIQSIRALENDCGNGPAGLAAKAKMKNEINNCKRLLYGVMYGHEPPVELPDNWGERR